MAESAPRGESAPANTAPISAAYESHRYVTECGLRAPRLRSPGVAQRRVACWRVGRRDPHIRHNLHRHAERVRCAGGPRVAHGPRRHA